MITVLINYLNAIPVNAQLVVLLTDFLTNHPSLLPGVVA